MAPGELLHVTDKAVVCGGDLAGVPVVVKMALTADPYWAARHRHVIAVYRSFETVPPPLATQRLLWHDDDVTVMTALPGVRLGDQRHLTDDPPASTVALLLDALDRIGTWQPPAGLAAPLAGYHDRGDYEHHVGGLDHTERRIVHQLLDHAGPGRVAAHGDVLRANMLLTSAACAVVDWEHTGPGHLPGYDHALLYTVTATAGPAIAHAVDTWVAARHAQLAFTINLAIVLSREIRIYRALPYGPVREERLANLDRIHRSWRQRMHALTGDLPGPSLLYRRKLNQRLDVRFCALWDRRPAAYCRS